MSTAMPAIADTLAFLATVADGATTPAAAQERLRAIQARHRDVDLQLVWEQESYDHSVHFDVLVRTAEATTVSLSVCRDRALPWPLRGVHRFTEANVLQVNGRMLTMEQAVGLLDILWCEAPIMERMIDTCLIEEELARRPIEIDDDELQRGLDGLRRAHRLYTAEATQRWMAQRGLTHEQLERLVIGNLQCARLRDRVAEGRIGAYLEAHPDQLETASVARVTCADEAVARQLAASLARTERGAIETVEAALADGAAAARVELITLRRHDARDGLGEAVFAARPGDVVGPVPAGGEFVVARVLARRPARPGDESTRAAIAQILFDAWLAERRAAAQLTWHWGRAPGPTDGR
jgi:putative peptide maturation system protein